MTKLQTIDPEMLVRGPWTPSHNAYDLIMACEGLRLLAYPDGGGRWTIGYGHTAGVTRGMAIGLDEAEQLLEDDIETAIKCLNATVKVPLTQDMVDALTDWIFNLGCHAFKIAPATIALNRGDYAFAAKRFATYDMADGRKEPGLVHRRAEEYRLFLTEY